MSNPFSANAAALGYLHQVRYALLLLLQAETAAEISLELLDDIALHKGGKAEELLQGKHSVKSQGRLTDSSEDLWKTLRVWMTLIESGQVLVDDIMLTLMTTDIAPDGSAASKLVPSSVGGRDVNGAEKILIDAATKSKRQSGDKILKIMSDFLNMSPTLRIKMLQKVNILDSSPNILTTRDKLIQAVRTATSEKNIDAFLQRLEGWWFDLVIKHLAKDSLNLISYRDLWNYIDEIREQFYSDNLPIDFLDDYDYDEKELNEDERVFIQQLRLVSVKSRRVQRAINDYHRAFQQRARWVREDLVNISELEKYEGRLKDAWESEFLIMCEKFEGAGCDEEICQAGYELFNKINQTFIINIREKCTEPYIMRGSYHMMSNKLSVGWHMKYDEMLRNNATSIGVIL